MVDLLVDTLVPTLAVHNIVPYYDSASDIGVGIHAHIERTLLLGRSIEVQEYYLASKSQRWLLLGCPWLSSQLVAISYGYALCTPRLCHRCICGPDQGWGQYSCITYLS